MPKKKKDDEIVEDPIADTEITTTEAAAESAAEGTVATANSAAEQETPSAGDVAAETEITANADTDTENVIEPAQESFPDDLPEVSPTEADTLPESCITVESEPHIEPEADITPERMEAPSPELPSDESMIVTDDDIPDISYKLSAEQLPEDAGTIEMLTEPDYLDKPEPDYIADDEQQQIQELLSESELPGESEELSQALAIPGESKPQPASIAPAPPRKKSFFELKLNDLDRGLSEEQRDEWNAIYASFRAKSIMSGTVIGVDQNILDITNRDTGEREKKTMFTLVIIGYRVKIIIPETELWMPGEERPPFTARAMAGSKVDFIVMGIDREGECAIASRRLALIEQRRFFARSEHHEGDLLTCNVTMVGAKRCSVECHGYDLLLTQRDLTHMSIPDLRENYRTGQELKCVLKAYNAKSGTLEISVKDTIPNPFEGAELRHPVRSRRQAVISGKYAGGVFCTLTDDTICLCLYSTRHQDADFRLGDGVILVITRYDFPRRLIFGRILSKW